MSSKKLSEMTKEERIQLILTDSLSYLDQVEGEQLHGILDSIAKTGPIDESQIRESNSAQ